MIRCFVTFVVVDFVLIFRHIDTYWTMCCVYKLLGMKLPDFRLYKSEVFGVSRKKRITFDFVICYVSYFSLSVSLGR
jgi:hypothetical protein